MDGTNGLFGNVVSIKSHLNVSEFYQPGSGRLSLISASHWRRRREALWKSAAFSVAGDNFLCRKEVLGVWSRWQHLRGWLRHAPSGGEVTERLPGSGDDFNDDNLPRPADADPAVTRALGADARPAQAAGRQPPSPPRTCAVTTSPVWLAAQGKHCLAGLPSSYPWSRDATPAAGSGKTPVRLQVSATGVQVHRAGRGRTPGTERDGRGRALA